MKLTADQLNYTYLRKSLNSSSAGDFTLDGNMMHIFFAVKEDQPASTIVEETGLDPHKVAFSLSKLIEFGLMEKVEPPIKYLGNDFFSALETNLKKAIGPMAEILIDEAIDEAGLAKDNVLVKNGAAILRTIAAEITDISAKQLFIKIMAEYLR